MRVERWLMHFSLTQAKSDFIERNVMFRTWPGRQKKQLVISLSTEKVCYGDKIIKQGQEADRVYFICRSVRE